MDRVERRFRAHHRNIWLGVNLKNCFGVLAADKAHGS
jgi:hypothetical protein